MNRSPQLVEVPVDRLKPEILESLVEEFVTRSGTDYGDKEHTLEQKKAAVLRALGLGEVAVVFDPETELTNLVPRDDLRAQSMQKPTPR